MFHSHKLFQWKKEFYILEDPWLCRLCSSLTSITNHFAFPPSQVSSCSTRYIVYCFTAPVSRSTIPSVSFSQINQLKKLFCFFMICQVALEPPEDMCTSWPDLKFSVHPRSRS